MTELEVAVLAIVITFLGLVVVSIVSSRKDKDTSLRKRLNIAFYSLLTIIFLFLIFSVTIWVRDKLFPKGASQITQQQKINKDAERYIEMNTTRKTAIDTYENYELDYAKTFSILESNGSHSKVVVLTFNGDYPDLPHLDIYKDTGSSYQKIYSFVADIPDSLTMSIGNVTPISDGGDPIGSLSGLLLSISKVGADYWGSYPVLIKYDPNKGFSLANFYSDNTADNPKIKAYMGTNRDIEISNMLDGDEKAKSILTQGVIYDNGSSTINISFDADNNCHACSHKIVTLKFPVGIPN